MCRGRQSECDIPEFCDGHTGNVSDWVWNPEWVCRMSTELYWLTLNLSGDAE